MTRRLSLQDRLTQVAHSSLADHTTPVRLPALPEGGFAGAGWFATPNILAKVEYVRQTHDGYPANHILHGGEFDGLMIEGVVAF